MMSVDAALKLLGHRAKDKVTEASGRITSVCFDLYGCIQADMQPIELDKDGKVRAGRWYDVERMEILSTHPCMEQPKWGRAKGASDKSHRTDRQ